MRKLKADKIISSNRKTISIEIKKDAEVWIRKPFSVSDKTAMVFFKEKLNWISKKLEEQKIRQSTKSDFLENQVLFEGQKYQVSIKSNIYEPYLSGKTLLLPDSDPSYYKLAFLYVKSYQKLPPWAWKLATKYKFKPLNIKISKARKSWGTCSEKASINLSWRLIQMPHFCQEYVICHELAHLKEMNHSKRFWRLVKKMIPNYKVALLWIKENQNLLL